MATERNALEPAYVLHLQPYRESSALVNLMTREHGRIALVARGVRGARSSTRVLLQPFAPLLVSWSARGDLGTLTAVERASALPPLDGVALISGMYLNELLMRLTHRFDPHPELFHGYGEMLGALSQAPPGGGSGMEESLRHFEKRLLESLGYGLLLDREAARGEPVQAQALYRYHCQHGPVRWADGDEGSLSGVPVHGHTLLALSAGAPLSGESRAQAKRLMRAEIDSHLGSRPLASRRLFRTRRSSAAVIGGDDSA